MEIKRMNNQKDIELKPCPFCGGEARFQQAYMSFPQKVWFVECGNDAKDGGSGCTVLRPHTDFYKTKKKAAEAWNRREGEKL